MKGIDALLASVFVASLTSIDVVASVVSQKTPAQVVDAMLSTPARKIDFAFLAPCPASGLIVHGTKDQVVPETDVQKLVDRLTAQKSIKIAYTKIDGANHFFDKHEADVAEAVKEYADARMNQPHEGR